MKQTLFIILFLSLFNAVVSAQDFHFLSDKKGRSVEAKIAYYSPSSNKVVLELRTGKKVTVLASVFDDKSQYVFQGWSQNKLHASGQLLKLDFKLNLVSSSQTKQKVTGSSFTDKNGKSFEVASSVFKTDHNRYSYDVRASNLSSSQLSLTNMVCSIFIHDLAHDYRYFDTIISGNTILGKKFTSYSTEPMHLAIQGKYPIITGLRIKGDILTSSGSSIPFTFYEPSELERIIKEHPHMEKYDPSYGEKFAR